MQRSRRDLLQRRSLEKSIWGKNILSSVSLLVLVLWGFVFLLNLWIGHGGIDKGWLSFIVLNELGNTCKKHFLGFLVSIVYVYFIYFVF